VPKGTERLRITPTPLHTDTDLQQLVRALDSVWDKLSLPRLAKPCTNANEAAKALMDSRGEAQAV